MVWMLCLDGVSCRFGNSLNNIASTDRAVDTIRSDPCLILWIAGQIGRCGRGEKETKACPENVLIVSFPSKGGSALLSD